MSKAYKRAGPPVPPIISDKHASECNLHGANTQNFSCPGINKTGRGCRNTPSVFRSGLWPVCGKHTNVDIPVARCQAVAVCGQVCDCLVKADPSFNLCIVHEKGTDTLPCHLLKIPTEIRQKIFRFLLPESISWYLPPRDPVCEYTSLLRLNKQISGEAVYVLYEQVPFDVLISESQIRICNMDHNFGSHFEEEQKWSSGRRISGANEAAFPKILHRIRNFRLNLALNGSLHPLWADPFMRITREDTHILSLRNSVREFSNACIRGDSTARQPKNTIINLEVYPVDHCQNNWAADETLAVLALVTGPLRLMGPVCRATMHELTLNTGFVDYFRSGRGIDTDWFKTEGQKFQSEWSNIMTTQTNTQSALNRYSEEWSNRGVSAKTQLNVIKNILKAFLGKGLASQHSSWSGATDIIKVTELVPCVSQLAYEQYDLKALERIQKILQDIWAEHCRKAQEPLLHVTNSLLRVVENPTRRLGMTQGYLKALAADKSKIQTFSSIWLELMKPENKWAPGPGSRLVSEDRLRRYYILDPEVRGNSEPLPYCVLKTPRVIRATRGTRIP